MSFRTVVIRERSKLELKMNYLVCRSTEETKVFIPEISVLILESTAISITTSLLSELIKNNVKIILCDEKHNPESELLPYYGSYNCSKKIKQQINWKDEIKALVWTEIIRLKISKQRDFLEDLNMVEASNLLGEYLAGLKINDETNREGHSAKVYFNTLFGNDYSRRDASFVSGALNYGYSILLSCFNREITKNGYLTQLGIWHKNEFNDFNLASDLMEPFRILVERIVYSLEDQEIGYKNKLLDIFNLKLFISGKQQYLENAIAIYCKSVFDALQEENVSLIRCYE